MAAPGLAGPAKKALATLDREWDGLAAHRDYPMIGLDNNTAERMIRGPVVTRKNAGGSRNGDTARNAAVIWTATATTQMASLNLLTWLTAYLDECGRNGGKPPAGPDLDRFLPSNAAPATSAPGHSRRHRPDKPAANTPAPAWLPNRPRRQSACHFTALPNTYLVDPPEATRDKGENQGAGTSNPPKAAPRQQVPGWIPRLPAQPSITGTPVTAGA